MFTDTTGVWGKISGRDTRKGNITRGWLHRVGYKTRDYTVALNIRATDTRRTNGRLHKSFVIPCT